MAQERAGKGFSWWFMVISIETHSEYIGNKKKINIKKKTMCLLNMNVVPELINSCWKLVRDVACLAAEDRLFQRTAALQRREWGEIEKICILFAIKLE